MTTKSTRWTKSLWRPSSLKVCIEHYDDDDDDDDDNNNNNIDGVDDEGDCDGDIMLAVMMMMMMTMRVTYVTIETLHGDDECHVF